MGGTGITDSVDIHMLQVENGKVRTKLYIYNI